MNHLHIAGRFMRKIAVPLVDGKLARQFIHADTLLVAEVDDHGTIHSRQYTNPPKNDPGILPDWLLSRGIMYIILNLTEEESLHVFERKSIVVLEGYTDRTPEDLIRMYAAGYRHVHHEHDKR